MSWIDFLNSNSPAIIAAASVISVVILAAYTYFTTLLWRATAEQARSASVQAAIAQRQLRTTERQLALARKSFVSLSRPHVGIRVLSDETAVTDAPELSNSSFRIFGENFGSVPAVITSVRFEVRPSMGGVPIHRLVPIVVPPSGTEDLGGVVLQAPSPELSEALVEELRATLGSHVDEDVRRNEIIPEMLWVHVYIEYNGIGSTRYHAGAQILFLRSRSGQRAWNLMAITPTGPDIPHVSDLRQVSSVPAPSKRRINAQTYQEKVSPEPVPPGLGADRYSEGRPSER